MDGDIYDVDTAAVTTRVTVSGIVCKEVDVVIGSYLVVNMVDVSLYCKVAGGTDLIRALVAPLITDVDGLFCVREPITGDENSLTDVSLWFSDVDGNVIE